MMTINETNAGFYSGIGKQNPDEVTLNFPERDSLTEPSKYFAPTDLAEAVNVALTLGLPLLITGEPGCGKSQLAYSLVWELKLPGKPVKFTVKSDTQSRDLFYSFDTLGRFRAFRDDGKGKIDSRQFLRFEALGLAILRALGRKEIARIDEGLARYLEKIVDPDPQQTVVLIDEIDKAPREVPNDILNEIENLEFDIPELYEAEKEESLVLKEKKLIALKESSKRPIIIITSNRERELPEAFLRRCVYFHLELPPYRDIQTQTDETGNGNSDSKSQSRRIVTIEEIVEERLGITIRKHAQDTRNSDKSVWAGCISFFACLRADRLLQKPPSTAELLSWLQLLYKHYKDDIDHKQVKDFDPYIISSAKVILLKHQEDQNRAQALYKDWLKQTT